MRDANVFAFKRAMPRMSWSPRNLYNLWRRTDGDKAIDITFKRTQRSLFQQRWVSKAVVRAYHGDFINEKIFKRWYLPSTLPDVRPRRRTLAPDMLSLNAYAKRDEVVQREMKRKQEEQAKGLPPVGSLMLSEVERRIDVFIFRCCFAHSVYEARRLVIHGDVLLNGKKHQNANTRLAPGDMVSVDPKAIRFLRGEQYDPEIIRESTADEGDSSSVASSSDNSRSTTEKLPDKKPSALTPFNLPPYASPHIFIPAYIEPSFSTCSAIYVRHPTARPGYSEIPTPYDADGEVVRLAWEWYAKVRPRMRSEAQLRRMPEDRERLVAKLGMEGARKKTVKRRF